MKQQMKYLVLAMVIIMLTQAISFTLVGGSESFSYEAEAQTLNDLGLYNGISETTFDPDLGAALNRETGVVMLLRIFGLEEEASALTNAETDAILAQYSDADSIASWAKTYVAYAVANGLVRGLPDGTFAPQANLVGKAYCTLILRQLGYEPNYDSAAAELVDVGGLTTTQAIVFSGKALIKDDLVGISFGSLSAVDSDGSTVIEQLLADNIVDERAAEDAGLIQPPPAPVPPPTPIPPPTPTTIMAPINNDRDDDDDDDNDDNNNITGTGVTGTLAIDQGSDGVKEVNKLTINNGTTSSDYLVFTISESQNIVYTDSFMVEYGDRATVASAVYANVVGKLEDFDVSLENGCVDIYFTAKTEDADRQLYIELVEGPNIGCPGFFGVGGAAGSEVTAGAAPAYERVELQINTGASNTGTVKLTINNNYAYVPVQAGNTTMEVTEKLLQGICSNTDFSALEQAYKISQDGDLIIFDANSTGNHEDLNITIE